MTSNRLGSDSSFESLLTGLTDENQPLRAALVYRLSDLQPGELAKLKAIWPSISVERRRLLLSRLVETSETSFDVDFSAAAIFALNDDDPQVRAHAIAALWETEDEVAMHRFIKLLRDDEAAAVRASAAEALGKFVLAGELGKLPAAAAREAEEALLVAVRSAHEPLDVQRRALESLAYSSREEVADLIEKARTHDEATMRSTAIFAMGRSADKRWARHVLAALEHPQEEMRYEAARAAGELGLTAAVSRLIDMARGSDPEIKEAAIWSLGEIGGSQAQQALFSLADQEEDGDLLKAIEDAVNTAALAAGELNTYLLSINHEDDLDYGDEEDDDFSDL